MPYCPECGVELEQFIKICPLCYSKSVNEKPSNIRNYPVLETDEEDIKDKKSRQKLRRLFFDIINLLAILSIISIILTELFVNHNIYSSRYAVTSIIYSWICISSLLAFFKAPYVAGSIIVPISAVFLALLDFFSGKMEWFFILGLPILGVIAFLYILTEIIIKVLHLRGLYVACIILLSISVFCCTANLFISKYLYDIFYIDWSLIVMVGVIPLIIILIFIQRRISNEIRMNKIFHI